MRVFDRQMLRRRRDRAADRFPAHDFLVRRAGEDIVDRIAGVNRSFGIAADLGAHRGSLRTATADAALQDGKIGTLISADLSAGMLAHAEGARVVADEEMLPFADKSLNLVTSILSLHWVNDLPGTLIQIRRADREKVTPILRDCGALLQRAGFALPVADTDRVTVRYADPLRLMAELRGMGETNALSERRRTPLKRGTLIRAAEIYREKFGLPDGRVPATFDIVIVTGWAPHESQQKPLAPGSANTRLADALGTEELPAGDKPPR